MSVIDGQNADAATFNAAFASKSADNTMTGKQTLNRSGSGASITDVQQAINDVTASDALKIPLTQKAAANGVATLDASTLIPVAQVPDLTASKITDFSIAADARITLQKGAASGIAPLDGSSKIDSTYLPSYVDDVVEVANYAALPVTGETGKIYVTLDTNNTYRWSGSVYVKIGQPIASTDDVPEGSINQYFTPARVSDKQIGIQFQDQGSNLGTTATVDTIDFIGAGITATRASNKVTVEVTATGSGGGSKNYFSQSSINPDFETGVVTPWQASTFTVSSGVPTGYTGTASNMALSITSTNPLAGANSMLLTKSASNAQYQGFISGEFTIDREDVAKVLYGSFAYEVVSGTVDFSGTSTQSLEIWIQNFSNGKWYQPAGYRGMNQSSGSGKVVFSFQTDGDPANNIYKIAVFTQQTSASAYVVKFDDFQVGPQAILTSSVITEWQEYVPTITAATTNPTLPTSGVTYNSAKWRRVGSNIEINYNYESGTVSGGNNGSGNYYFSLPLGLSVDLTKLPSGGSFSKLVGLSRLNTSAVRDGSMAVDSSGRLLFLFESGGTDVTPLNSAVLVFTTNNAALNFNASIPIQGWSSSSQISSDSDQRVIALSYNNNSGTTVTANTTDITFSTKDVDQVGAWSGTIFTAPVSGWYQAVGSINITVADTGQVRVYVDGVYKYTCSSNSSGTSTVKPFSASVYLNAGQTMSFRASLTATLNANANTHWVMINKLSGPSVITATETICSIYETTGNSIGTSPTLIKYGTKIIDTHGAYSPGASGTGLFTAPVSGVYSISGQLYTAAVTLTTGQSHNILVYLDGVMIKQAPTIGSGGNASYGAQLNFDYYLNAGQTISFYGSCSVATTAGIVERNIISIKKAGN